MSCYRARPIHDTLPIIPRLRQSRGSLLPLRRQPSSPLPLYHLAGLYRRGYRLLGHNHLEYRLVGQGRLGYFRAPHRWYPILSCPWPKSLLLQEYPPVASPWVLLHTVVKHYDSKQYASGATTPGKSFQIFDPLVLAVKGGAV